jgi:hypothetical protein
MRKPSSYLRDAGRGKATGNEALTELAERALGIFFFIIDDAKRTSKRSASVSMTFLFFCVQINAQTRPNRIVPASGNIARKT